LGAGAVGIGIGAGFGLASSAKHDDARSHCNGDLCDSTGVTLRQDAIHMGNVSTVAFIAGGAAFVGGLVLVLTAPKGTEVPVERSSKLRAAPTIGAGGGGVTLHGAF
jgi:hypothetical protein